MQSSIALFSGSFIPFALIVAFFASSPPAPHPPWLCKLYFAVLPSSPSPIMLFWAAFHHYYDSILRSPPRPVGCCVDSVAQPHPPGCGGSQSTFPRNQFSPLFVEFVMGGQPEGLQPRGPGSTTGRRLSMPRLPGTSGGGSSSSLAGRVGWARRRSLG